MAVKFTAYFVNGSYFDCDTKDSPSELKERVTRSIKNHEPLVCERPDSQFIVNLANLTFLEIKKTDESEEVDQ